MANIFLGIDDRKKPNKILGKMERLDDREADKYAGEFQDHSKSE